MDEPSSAPCVAVVDDDESMCRSLARLLRASGIRSKLFSSAESFLQDQECPHFACLILDVHLGGMSGIELQERLATTGSSTPVIFITAHDEPNMRDRAMRCGCIAYLTKKEPSSTVLAAITLATNAASATRGRPLS